MAAAVVALLRRGVKSIPNGERRVANADQNPRRTRNDLRWHRTYSSFKIPNS
jgi:hypothetical protein